MIKLIFSLLVLAVVGIIFTGYYLSVESYKSDKTDHFNGKVFYNNPNTTRGSFVKALKWMITRTPPVWQKQSYGLQEPLRKHTEVVTVTPIIHASVLIQTPELNILTDPIWSERASPFSFIGPKRVYKPPVAIEDLPKIDVVLVSHNHYDHMDFLTLKKLEKRFSPIFVTGLGNKAVLKKIGLKNVIELDWWQKAEKLPIYFMPAQHFSGRGLYDRNFTLWGGFLIKSGNKKIYFAGDTGYGPFLNEIYTRYGAIDLAIIPIGAYMPRSFMRQMHLNPDDAVKAMLDLHASHALGIHFDSFARLADEPQFSAGKDLQISLKNRKLDLARFIAPVPGKSYEFN